MTPHEARQAIDDGARVLLYGAGPQSFPALGVDVLAALHVATTARGDTAAAAHQEAADVARALAEYLDAQAALYEAGERCRDTGYGDRDSVRAWDRANVKLGGHWAALRAEARRIRERFAGRVLS